MDYEKKYNEALERAKTLYENANGMIIKKWVEQVFPELAESEDERIRKSLIDMLKNDEKCYLKEIAWLEKQGEQEHQYKSRPRYVGEEELLGANKQGEQRPAWSIQDDLFLIVCKDALAKYHKSDNWDANIIIDWLESKLKSIKPQPKQEWSEEDELAIKQAIYVCHQNGYTAVENWLKSIKDRVQHQNTCKSSGEHHELEEFAKIVRCNLTGISKSVQQLFEAKYLQLTGNKMYEGFKD